MLKFKVEETYYLYWFHEKTMTDIKTQGYIVDWENSHPLLGVKSYSEIKSM